MTLPKVNPFTKKPTDLPDSPSPVYSAQEIKEHFQTPSDELAAAHNSLTESLEAPTGASEVGAKEGTNNTNVQAVLDKLSSGKATNERVTTAENRITGVEGRLNGAEEDIGTLFNTDSSLQSQINTSKSDITSLKTNKAEKTEIQTLQNQVDRLVVDGDSSPAIAQALAGTEYTTLKQKLDATDGQLAETAKSKTDWLNVVEAFNVDNTGATYANNAINNAINSITSGTIYIPDGTYKLNGKLFVTKSNVTISLAPNAVLKMDSNVYDPLIHVQGTSSARLSNVKVLGGQLKGQKNVNSASLTPVIQSDKGVYFEYVDGGIISTSIDGIGSNGIDTEFCTKITVKANIITNAYDEGIFTKYGSKNKVIDNYVQCVGSFAQGDGINCWESDTQIINNTVEGGAAGITIGNFEPFAPNPYNFALVLKNVTVSKNRLLNPRGGGIVFLGVTDSVISENILSGIGGTATAVYIKVSKKNDNSVIQPSTDNIIKGNIISGNSTGAGIYISEDAANVNNIVDGNTINGCGVSLNIRSSKTKVVNNTAKNGVTNLRCASDECLLQGNTLVGATSNHGIWNSGNKVQIIVNKVANNMQNGIISTGSNCTIQGNHAHDNSQQTANSYDGLNISGNDNQVSLNQASNITGSTQRYGLVVNTGATGNKVSGNVLSGNQTGSFVNNGTNTEINGITSGTSRPTTDLYIGKQHFDTTLGKQISLKQTNPAVWVDATGATV